MNRFKTVKDVVDWRLCLNCGACAYICPDKKIQMDDIPNGGFLPKLQDTNCSDCTQCLDVCPGLGVDHESLRAQVVSGGEYTDEFGPVLEVWEGFSTDPEIRFRGSSGGVLTALSLFGLSAGEVEGVLQLGADAGDVTRNIPRLSKSRQDLLCCVGSRYSSGSVLERLDLLEQTEKPSIVIGLPSEIDGLHKITNLRPLLRDKIALTLSFFCAGSPSRKGTLDLLLRLGVSPDRLELLRYRGHGWPGMFTTKTAEDQQPREHMTYQESWAFLQKYRSISTHLYPDGSGEFADISCGDPWYRPIAKDEAGSSLVVIRTERGRAYFARALKSGCISAVRVGKKELLNSQRNLISKRGAIGGRLAAFALLGIPRPRHKGFSLGKNWMRLPIREMAASFFGTIRRSIQRKYYKRINDAG